MKLSHSVHSGWRGEVRGKQYARLSVIYHEDISASTALVICIYLHLLWCDGVRAEVETLSFLGCFREIYLNCCQRFVQEAQRLIMGKHEVPVASIPVTLLPLTKHVVNEEHPSVALTAFRH